jgi:hypothetical protein
VRAVFQRETKRLENGATLLQWQLKTDGGRVIDDNLANAPTVQGREVYFVTSADVAGLDTVEMVADLAESERGKRLALYRIARESCAASV